MIARSSLALHNQKTLNDDSFILSFVARHPLLETLLRRLRSAEPDGGGRHYVLIGPRGMGKTSLLRRIAIAINREPDLAARFIPPEFPRGTIQRPDRRRFLAQLRRVARRMGRGDRPNRTGSSTGRRPVDPSLG